MKEVTSLANEVIAKLVSMIEDEYNFAEFSHYEYARNSANFKDENEQFKYSLWSGGRLEAMKNVKDKAKEIINTIAEEP